MDAYVYFQIQEFRLVWKYVLATGVGVNPWFFCDDTSVNDNSTLFGKTTA